MKKKDLKTGDIITTRNKDVYQIIKFKGELFALRDQLVIQISLYSDNLRILLEPKFDIIKIQRPDKVHQLKKDFWHKAPTIWERPEPLNGWCVPESEGWDKFIALLKNGEVIHLLNKEGKPYKQRKEHRFGLDLRPATPEEIEERLFKSEQCQRYIDSEYECLSELGTHKGEFNFFNSLKINKFQIWLKFKDFGSNMICDSEGNWAEIKEKKMEKLEYVELLTDGGYTEGKYAGKIYPVSKLFIGGAVDVFINQEGTTKVRHFFKKEYKPSTKEAYEAQFNIPEYTMEELTNKLGHTFKIKK